LILGVLLDQAGTLKSHRVLHEEIEAAETKQLCIEVSQQSLCSWLAKIGQGLWLILFRNFQLYQLHIFLCWFYQELKL